MATTIPTIFMTQSVQWAGEVYENGMETYLVRFLVR
jgi:hypothetical protein